MAYHINDRGEVGVCHAQQHCRFGNFENQHYVTEDEARLAYEAAMEGRTLEAGYKQSLDRDRGRDKWLSKRRRKIEEQVKRPILPEVQRGFFVTGGTFTDVYLGDEVLGGKLQDMRKVPRKRATRYVVTYADYHSVNVDIPWGVNDSPNPDTQVWVDATDEEARQVREAAITEYNASISAENVREDLRRPGLAALDETAHFSFAGPSGEDNSLQWRPRTYFTRAMRQYFALTDNLRKANVANPSQLALRKMEEGVARIENYDPRKDFQTFFRPQGIARCARLVRAIISQDDDFKPDYLDKIILTQSFPKGRRPFVDYSFQDLGLKLR